MINNKKILAITLARSGSSRVKNKNYIDLCGKPLIQYTTDEVVKSRFIDKYIVSTDDKQIKLFCKNNNIEYYNRSNELASDKTKTADSLLEVIENINSEEYYYIVECMCTNPLKTIKDIDGCIEKIEQTNSDTVVSVVRVWDYHPSRIKYIENDILKDFYPEIKESRRQDLHPPAYIRNGSIYITKKELLYKNKVRLNGIICPYIMSENDTINIDEPRDVEIAKILIAERQKHGKS